MFKLRPFSPNFYYISYRWVSSKPQIAEKKVLIDKHAFPIDEYTNVTKKILTFIGQNIYHKKYHPLNIIYQRIQNYFDKTFLNSKGNPIFPVFDNLTPIVSVNQNFDSLLIPKEHISRSKSDCYYVNKDYLLRAHMTAHQSELLTSGLNNFLMVGDVYRRDEIDSTHYPVFHQVDAVRLKNRYDIFGDDPTPIFEVENNTNSDNNNDKQSCHTIEAVKHMENELKQTLEGLTKHLFGNVEYRWVTAEFPFTYPSWELEILYDNKWMEILGCGIMKQPILTNSGENERIGWAFGMGLERLAMILFQIPDIRLFWSKDTGFLSQFKTSDINKPITYKAVSVYPQCIKDMSFWLPDNAESFSSKDFYDLVRNEGGDMVEQVELIDTFAHPKTNKISNCYRIIYRDMHKTLTTKDTNAIHKRIGQRASSKLGVTLRI